MDVFRYLNEDNALVVERLFATTKHYSQWPFDRVFEEAKRALQATRDHFEKESLLENNLKCTKDMKALLNKAAKKRADLMGEVENLVMMHVDEPAFESGLESVANKFEQYGDYCQKKLYPVIKEHLSKDDMAHIQDQFNMILH